MQLLAPLAALLGIEVDVLLARMKRNAVVYAVLALLFAVALVFLLVAAHVALSDVVGPLWAALCIAGVALLVALIVFLWARAAEQGRQRRAAERRRASEATAMATSAALAALPMLLRNPKLGLLAIPIGVAVGYVLWTRKAKRPESD